MKTWESLINSQLFRFCAMAVHGVGMVNAIFRLWFFCMLLIVTMDLSHESFKHWNALKCVIRGPSLFVKTFARSFRGNTKAYWIVLSSNIKPYILRSSLMVNLEFWIPLAAPPFPFSFCICWVWLLAGRGGRGGRWFVLWIFITMMRSSCSYSLHAETYVGKYIFLWRVGCLRNIVSLCQTYSYVWRVKNILGMWVPTFKKSSISHTHFQYSLLC